MKFRRYSMILGVLLLTVVTCAKLTPEKKDVLDKTMSDISFTLETNYYGDIKTDDEFSKRVLKNYLDALDYNHQYFTQDEVDEIYKKWGTTLDENFLEGDSTAAFEIYETYKKAVLRVTDYQKKLLEKPKKLDFSKKEKLVFDREELPYFKSEKDYDNHWRKMLKSSILSLEDYEELTYDKAVERTKSRLETRIKLLDKKTTDDIYSYFLNSFLAEYDPHTSYFSAKAVDRFNESMRLQLSGIGAVLTTEKGYLKVVKVLPNGPAGKGKELMAEDKIIAVATDGKTFEDITDWPINDSIDLIKGKIGTTVKLKVIPSGSKTAKIYTFVREKIKLDSNAAKYFIKTKKVGDKSYKVGVINLPAFYMDFDAYSKGDENYSSTTRDIKKIIEKLNKEKVDGLIIDLRNNGGGSLSEVNNLIGLFIPYGPTVQVKGGGKTEFLADRDGKVYFDKPVIVMVNRLSASASEIFAAAMQDYGRGLIVGTTTFGKGTVQVLDGLESGELHYTIQKFYRITGGSTQHKGVTPDILFPPTYNSENIGESSLQNPLKWDKIDTLLVDDEHAKNNKLIEYLATTHKKRVKSDPEFIYEVDRYKIVEETSNDKEISLNRKVRVRETKELEDKWLLIMNKKRLAQKKKAFKNYDELEDYTKGRAKLDELDLLKEDGQVDETVNIMIDEINFKKKK